MYCELQWSPPRLNETGRPESKLNECVRGCVQWQVWCGFHGPVSSRPDGIGRNLVAIGLVPSLLFGLGLRRIEYVAEIHSR